MLLVADEWSNKGTAVDSWANVLKEAAGNELDQHVHQALHQQQDQQSDNEPGGTDSADSGKAVQPREYISKQFNNNNNKALWQIKDIHPSIFPSIIPNNQTMIHTIIPSHIFQVFIGTMQTNLINLHAVAFNYAFC